MQVDAVVLAGGRGSRVGYQQKALMPYRGRPIVSTVIERLESQCRQLWLNVNAEQPAYRLLADHLFDDGNGEYLGPLAGMASAWRYVDSEWILFVPCDNPDIPIDLVARLQAAYQLQPNPLVVVNDGERLQPLYLLMHRQLQASLEQAISVSHLSVMRWIKEQPHSIADCSDLGGQAFKNYNELFDFTCDV